MNVFTHDCKACIFLGRGHNHLNEGQGYDFYFCKDSTGGDSLIARYGDEGSEYGSLTVDAVRGCPKTHALGTALQFAISLGLVPEHGPVTRMYDMNDPTDAKAFENALLAKLRASGIPEERLCVIREAYQKVLRAAVRV